MKRPLMLSLLAALLVTGVAYAWHGRGHSRITTLAVKVLPNDVPAFFREGGGRIASICQDPDMFTKPIAPAELHDAEASEHYFDIDIITGRDPNAIAAFTLPPTRYAYIEQCYSKGLKPNKVGLLPYALTEWTQKLTIAFAEHRKWPNDKAVQAKCLLYAAMVAHYAEDLCQPLHTTMDYDGRAKNGRSPRSGIHLKVDTLVEKLRVDDATLLKDLKVASLAKIRSMMPATAAASLPASTSTPALGFSAPAGKPAMSPLLAAILSEIKASYSQVETVYALESELPAQDDGEIKSAKVRAFAIARARAATRFTASLYLTAWRSSASIQFPPWHTREHQ